MAWTDFFSLSSRSFFVPWIRFEAPEGGNADGPLLRVALGRRELLAWTTREGAEKAGQELVAKTGGSYEVRTMTRRDLEKQCRVYSTWKSPVVTAFFKT